MTGAVRARVQIVVEVEADSCWTADTTVQQVRAQAIEDARKTLATLLGAGEVPERHRAAAARMVTPGQVVAITIAETTR